MSGPERPTAPSSLPKYLREGLDKQDAETLRDIAEFASQLASYREQLAAEELEEEAVDEDELPPDEWDHDDWEQALAEADAPGRATLTVKTINDNDYYYLQWRDGDEIKSEYVSPVSPDRQD